MKNSIYIDIDTDRENSVMIGKPPSIPQPSTKEEAKIMVLHDIDCITDALLSMVNMADLNGYKTKQKIVLSIITRLTDFLTKQEDGHQTKT